MLVEPEEHELSRRSLDNSTKNIKLIFNHILVATAGQLKGGRVAIAILPRYWSPPGKWWQSIPMGAAVQGAELPTQHSPNYFHGTRCAQTSMSPLFKYKEEQQCVPSAPIIGWHYVASGLTRTGINTRCT